VDTQYLTPFISRFAQRVAIIESQDKRLRHKVYCKQKGLDSLRCSATYYLQQASPNSLSTDLLTSSE